MKKLFALLLVFLLPCMTLLGACSGQNNTDEGNNSQGGTDVNDPEKPDPEKPEPEKNVFNVYSYTEHSSITGAETVNKNENYNFTVVFEYGYIPGDNFSVKVNGKSVEPVEAGKYDYVVSQVVCTLTITVSGVEESVVPVEFVGFGFSVVSESSYAHSGESFEFSLDLQEGYDGVISVQYSVTGEEKTALEALNGKYIIPDVTQPVTVYVEGLTAKKCRVEYSDGSDALLDFGQTIPSDGIATEEGYELVGWYVNGIAQGMDYKINGDITVQPRYGKIVGGSVVDYRIKITGTENQLKELIDSEQLNILYGLKLNYYTYRSYCLTSETVAIPDDVKTVLDEIDSRIEKRYAAIIERMEAVDKSARALLVDLYYKYDDFVTAFGVIDEDAENNRIISDFMAAIGYLETDAYTWTYDDAKASADYSNAQEGYANVTNYVIPGSISWAKDWAWNVRFQNNGNKDSSEILIKMPLFNFGEHDKVSFYITSAYGQGSRKIEVYNGPELGYVNGEPIDSASYCETVEIAIENGCLYFNGELKQTLSDEILNGQEPLVLKFDAGMNTCISGYNCFKLLTK